MKQRPKIIFKAQELTSEYAVILMAKSEHADELTSDEDTLNSSINHLLFGNPETREVYLLSHTIKSFGDGFLGGILKRVLPKTKVSLAKNRGFEQVGSTKMWKKGDQLFEEKDGFLVPKESKSMIHKFKSLLLGANDKSLSTDFRKVFAFPDVIEGSDPYLTFSSNTEELIVVKGGNIPTKSPDTFILTST